MRETKFARLPSADCPLARQSEYLDAGHLIGAKMAGRAKTTATHENKTNEKPLIIYTWRVGWQRCFAFADILPSVFSFLFTEPGDSLVRR